MPPAALPSPLLAAPECLPLSVTRGPARGQVSARPARSAPCRVCAPKIGSGSWAAAAGGGWGRGGRRPQGTFSPRMGRGGPAPGSGTAEGSGSRPGSGPRTVPSPMAWPERVAGVRAKREKLLRKQTFTSLFYSLLPQANCFLSWVLRFFSLAVEVSLSLFFFFFFFGFSCRLFSSHVPLEATKLLIKRHPSHHGCLLLLLAVAALGADLVAPHGPARTSSEEGRLWNSFYCILDAVTALEPDEQLKFSGI